MEQLVTIKGSLKTVYPIFRLPFYVMRNSLRQE